MPPSHSRAFAVPSVVSIGPKLSSFEQRAGRITTLISVLIKEVRMSVSRSCHVATWMQCNCQGPVTIEQGFGILLKHYRGHMILNVHFIGMTSEHDRNKNRCLSLGDVVALKLDTCFGVFYGGEIRT